MSATKRPASATEPANQREAKRSRYDYKTTVEIRVWTQPKSVASLSPSETCVVHEERFFQHSTYAKSLISTQTNKGVYCIYETNPKLFKYYLDWIHDRVFYPEYNEQEDSSLAGPIKNLAYDEKSSGVIFLKLYKLLVLNDDYLKDDTFKAEILKMLASSTVKKGDGWKLIRLDDISKLWIFTNGASWLAEWIPTWKSAALTRDRIEASSIIIPYYLKLILRRNVAPMTLKIRFGPESAAVERTTSREAATRRSKTIVSILGRRSNTNLLGDDVDEGAILVSYRNTHVVSMWMQTLELRDWDIHVASLSTSKGVVLQKELCLLWTLAIDYEDVVLERAIISYFIGRGADEQRRGRTIVTKGLMEAIDATREGGGLRRWFIDLVCASTEPPEGWQKKYHGAPQPLLLDIFAQLMQNTNANKPATFPQLTDLDKYCNDLPEDEFLLG